MTPHSIFRADTFPILARITCFLQIVY